MKAHIIMNDALAPPGAIEYWMQHNNHSSSITKAYLGEDFPSVETFDFLIILGGAAGAYEEDQYEWLKSEKQFISKAIEADKFVLGICLGAQMIAEVLGGQAYPMSFEEVGWKNVSLSFNFDQVNDSKLLYNIPNEFTVFQYHGDTFDLPEKVKLIGEGMECRNQIFKYGNKVLGLQFHPEFTKDILENIIEFLSDDLKEKLHFENKDELYEVLVKKDLISDANNLLFQLLDNLTD